MKAIATMYNPSGFDVEYAPLREMGMDVDYKVFDPAGLAPVSMLSGYPYLIASGEYYDAQTLRDLQEKGLKMIVRMGVGYDHIDMEAARKFGVLVANTPGANANAVAEHAVMLTLAAARGAVKNNADVHAGLWRRTAPKDLTGCTFGLVGFGNIARRYAELIRPFADKIVAYDPWANPAMAATLGVELTSFDALLQNADVISLHLPLTDETRGLFDTCAFAKMKKNTVFVNTSRGEIVDELALVNALKDGTLLGAGLDVLCSEPPAEDHPLFAMENCLITPHNASLTEDAFKRMTTTAVRTIISHIHGERIPNLV